MRGHTIDDKCGGTEFIPYRESEDQAYDRYVDEQLRRPTKETDEAEDQDQHPTGS